MKTTPSSRELSSASLFFAMQTLFMWGDSQAAEWLVRLVEHEIKERR